MTNRVTNITDMARHSIFNDKNGPASTAGLGMDPRGPQDENIALEELEKAAAALQAPTSS